MGQGKGIQCTLLGRNSDRSRRNCRIQGVRQNHTRHANHHTVEGSLPQGTTGTPCGTSGGLDTAGRCSQDPHCCYDALQCKTRLPLGDTSYTRPSTCCQLGCSHIDRCHRNLAGPPQGTSNKWQCTCHGDDRQNCCRFDRCSHALLGSRNLQGIDHHMSCSPLGRRNPSSGMQRICTSQHQGKVEAMPLADLDTWCRLEGMGCLHHESHSDTAQCNTEAVLKCI